MAANYLYGPETVEVENGARPIKTVKFAIVGPIGTAPMEDVNTLVQCLSEKDVAAFDSQFTGLTIPQVLSVTYNHGAGTVLIINVLDPAKHRMAIKGGAVTFGKSTRQARLAYPVVANVVVKDSKGSTTHTANTDYRVDAQASVFMNLSKAIEVGGSVKVSHEYVDPSKVTAADIIGGVSSTGNRTNIKLLNDSFNLYGYFVKTLIVSMFCTQKSVTVELIVMVEKLGAITHIDVPVGTTFAQALAGCGPEGTINFNTSSDHVRPCYSHVEVYDPMTNTERLEPLSQRVVGPHARVDLDKGYWWSSPNQEILEITGVECRLSVMIDNLQSKVNLLNEQGITAVFSNYGSGFRLWSDRTAAWLAVIHMRNFGNIRRIGGVISEPTRYLSQ